MFCCAEHGLVLYVLQSSNKLGAGVIVVVRTIKFYVVLLEVLTANVQFICFLIELNWNWTETEILKVKSG